MPVSEAELEAVVEAALTQPNPLIEPELQLQPQPMLYGEAAKRYRGGDTPPPWQMMLEPVLLSTEGTMADLAMLSIAISLTKIAEAYRSKNGPS